jgi:hypothetical protein
MNADVYADWLREQRLRVVRTASSYWAEVGPRVYQAVPVHWVILPSEQELRDLLEGHRALAARYSTPLDAPQGMISYHVTYCGSEYTLQSLPKKARYDVRKGMETFAVAPITWNRLATDGWRLRFDTLVRQGRVRAESQPWWEGICRSAASRKGFEAWGAIHRATGELASSLLALRCDNTMLILYQQSATGHLAAGVNNVLSFVACQNFLSRCAVDTVFYGLHSLDAPESVDAYKWRMRFSPRPLRQRVAFHPWARPFVTSGAHETLRRLLRLWPASATLAKAEGMVRFYLQGRRPLGSQQWPEALIEERERILRSIGGARLAERDEAIRLSYRPGPAPGIAPGTIPGAVL